MTLTAQFADDLGHEIDAKLAKWQVQLQAAHTLLKLQGIKSEDLAYVLCEIDNFRRFVQRGVKSDICKGCKRESSRERNSTCWTCRRYRFLRNDWFEDENGGLDGD